MTRTTHFSAINYIKASGYTSLIEQYILGLILLVCFVSPSSAAISSNTTIVHEPSYFRLSTGAMHKDKNDQLNVFYGGNHLYRAIYDGNQWASEIIDNSPRVGLYATAATDKDGSFYVLYRDEHNKNVKLATNKTGAWTYESLEWYGIDFNSPESIGSLAVDSNGVVHIACSTPISSYVNYATNGSGVWVIEELEQFASSKRFNSISIAIDQTDTPHIIFSPSKAPITGQIYELIHAYKTLDNWDYETIDTGSSVFDFSFNSILIDSLNKLHIAYSGPYDNDLYYATNKTGTWVKDVVHDSEVGYKILTPSIVMKKGGAIGIAYLLNRVNSGLFIYETIDLRYAENSTGTWIDQFIVATNIDTIFTSAQYDNSDNANLAFFDENDLTLKHYTLSANHNIDYSEEEDAILQKWPNVKEVGMYPETVTDNNGFSYICYLEADFFGTHTEEGGYDVIQGDLIYATNSSGKWEWVELSNQKGVTRCNIAVDSMGYAHIVYESNSLKYVSNKTGSWVTEEFIYESTAVSTGNGKEQRIAIQVDSSGNIYLAYMNLYGDGDVRYGSNSTGAWVFETAASIGDDWGSQSDYSVFMSIGSTGEVHLAYLDRDKNLTYTNKNNLAWTTETIALYDPSLRWRRKDIELDENGVIHMVYSSSRCSGNLCFPGPMMYGSNINGEWSQEAIDDDAFFLQRENLTYERKSKLAPSISIANNSINVGYFTGYTDTGNTENNYINLYYAFKKGGLWRKNIADSVSHMGWYTAISNKDDSSARIAFYDAGNESLKLTNISHVPGPMIDVVYSINNSSSWDINVGDSRSASLTIRNIGQSNLTVSSIDILNDTAGELLLDLGSAQSSCQTTPINLTPNSDCTLSLIYAPTIEGQSNFILNINSNDPDLSDLGIEYVGKATALKTSSSSGTVSLFSLIFLLTLMMFRRVNGFDKFGKQ